LENVPEFMSQSATEVFAGLRRRSNLADFSKKVELNVRQTMIFTPEK
jgi:hypothetical protein